MKEFRKRKAIREGEYGGKVNTTGNGIKYKCGFHSDNKE